MAGDVWDWNSLDMIEDPTSMKLFAIAGLGEILQPKEEAGQALVSGEVGEATYDQLTQLWERCVPGPVKDEYTASSSTYRSFSTTTLATL